MSQNDNIPSQQPYEEKIVTEGWALKDDEEFFKNQTKLRAHLRIERGHEKPVDHIAHVAGLYFNIPQLSLQQEKKGFKSEMNAQLIHRPYQVLSNLSDDEISDLIEDIQEYAAFYPDYQDYTQFWDAIRTLARFYREVKQSADPRLRHAQNQSEFYELPLASEVSPLLEEVLNSQDSNGLRDVEAEIKALLPTKALKADLQYWGVVLKRIEVRRAKKKIEEICSAHYKPPEIREQGEQGDVEEKQTVVTATVTPPRYCSDDELDNGIKVSAIAVSDLFARKELQDRRAQILSIQVKKMQRELKLKTEEEKKDIYRLRGLEGDQNVRFKVDRTTAWEDKMLKLLQESLEEDEEVFADEVTLARLGSGWEPEQEKKDKFALRKPRYFNCRKTGFEWNRFNQNHYQDAKNPPKIILGYKFNIFYPDLLDKFKTPQYHLQKSDIPDMLTIRFEAGAPYEDIAFRIVAREWDLSEHAGFLCIFEKGVLHLHFNFKTFKYRR